MEIRLVEGPKIEVETLGMEANTSKSDRFEILVIERLATINQNLVRVEIALIPYEEGFCYTFLLKEVTNIYTRS